MFLFRIYIDDNIIFFGNYSWYKMMYYICYIFNININ